LEALTQAEYTSAIRGKSTSGEHPIMMLGPSPQPPPLSGVIRADYKILEAETGYGQYAPSLMHHSRLAQARFLSRMVLNTDCGWSKRTNGNAFATPGKF